MSEDAYIIPLFSTPVKTDNRRLIEIQAGMNVTSITAIGAGGGGNGGGTTGAGGGGGAIAIKNTGLSFKHGDKIAYTLGYGGQGGLDSGAADAGTDTAVCLASNRSTLINIDGETTPNQSTSYQIISQTFTVPGNFFILNSISANIYYIPNSSAVFNITAELTRTSPTGVLSAYSATRKTSDLSTDGSTPVEFFFGAVVLNPSSVYSVNFIIEGAINADGSTFGALSTSNTYAGGSRWNRDYGNPAPSFVQVPGEDVKMTVNVFPFGNLLVAAAGGSGASGSTGGAGGLDIDSVGDVKFSGGNGGNAQGGGGSRAGSGGGSPGLTTGPGANGSPGAGSSAGIGGAGEIFTAQNVEDPFATLSSGGGLGADSTGTFTIASRGENGGGGGGACNQGFEATGANGGTGLIILTYDGLRNKSNSRMLNMFSPI